MTNFTVLRGKMFNRAGSRAPFSFRVAEVRSNLADQVVAEDHLEAVLRAAVDGLWHGAAMKVDTSLATGAYLPLRQAGACHLFLAC